MIKRMVCISDVFRCIWCEKVWATKVELFQHFLIDHQDNLVASAEAESDRPSGSSKDPKLQKEIADLEKRVLGNYKVRHIAHSSIILKIAWSRGHSLVIILRRKSLVSTDTVCNDFVRQY